MGRINAVHYEEGDTVKAGELLIGLDNAELHAELASAQASLGMARAELEHARREEERVKKLYRAKSLSQDELDDTALAHAAAREQLKMAQASVVKAQTALDETRIQAPFPGVIIHKQAEIGQVTQPGAMLFVLEDHSQLKLRSRVKEHDVPHISIGQGATVTIDALDGLKLRGTVSKIIPSGDLSTHAFVVEVMLPAQNKLYPGMFGKADFGL
jgi:RND family efflux transporter MFP subunit